MGGEPAWWGLLMRQATASGQAQDRPSGAAERQVFAGPAGQLSACPQMACCPGSGSVSAAGRADLTGIQDGRRGDGHRPRRQRRQQLQAADRRLSIADMQRACLAAGKAGPGQVQIPVATACSR